MSNTKKKELHSSHIFMFPFRFDLNREGFDYEFEFYKECSIKERIPFDINDIKSRLSDVSWIHESFNLATSVQSSIKRRMV